jgi:hypothetical protein
MTEQDAQQRITWDKPAEEKFLKILEDIPEMIRGIAEARACRKAEDIVRAQNRQVIGEKDMVDAFFAETPGGFMPVMKNSMRQIGLDYTQYGHA